MRVTARLFGALADRVGQAYLELDLPDGATAATLRDAAAAANPAVRELVNRVSVAVNHEVVAADHPVRPGDEVALLPPVAGGEATVVTGLRAPPLPVEEAVAAVAHPSAGATVVFLGTVRDHSAGMDEVQRLDYSAYEEMASGVLDEVAAEVAARWQQVTGVAILHAVGKLEVGAHTVLVACSAPHRGIAFDACRHALEQTKQRVPVWKHEHGPAGSRWVGADPKSGAGG